MRSISRLTSLPRRPHNCGLRGQRVRVNREVQRTVSGCWGTPTSWLTRASERAFDRQRGRRGCPHRSLGPVARLGGAGGARQAKRGRPQTAPTGPRAGREAALSIPLLTNSTRPDSGLYRCVVSVCDDLFCTENPRDASSDAGGLEPWPVRPKRSMRRARVRASTSPGVGPLPSLVDALNRAA